MQPSLAGSVSELVKFRSLAPSSSFGKKKSAPAPVPWSWLKTSSRSAAPASAPAKKAQKLQFQFRLNPPWISMLFVHWNQVLRTQTYRNNIKICVYFRWKASIARIKKNMADLFSKQEKPRDILSLQKSRNNCDCIKFRGIFAWMNNFPMIFQAQFVSFSQLPTEWWRYSWEAALN